MMTQLYFGTVDIPGHYFWSTKGKRHAFLRARDADIPWDQIDGGLTPKTRSRQGDGLLHVKDGWTALAVHDYTIDGRPGSNSVFLISEEYNSLEGFLRRLREWPEDSFFGKLLERIGEIRLVEE